MDSNNTRGSMIMYQSLSFTMIRELLDNKNTPAWIKIWLYFSILQKYGKKIYAKNQYIADKLDIPLGTVKYSITKLRDDGLIEILNSGSWLRQIKLTHIATIDENSNKEIKDKNEYQYHSIYDRKLYKDNVYLSDEEYTSLIEHLGDEKTLEQYINGINEYLSQSIIKYSSHYELILIWFDKNEQQVKNKKKKFDNPNYQWFMEVERGYIKKESTLSDEERDFFLNYDWLNDSDNE